MTSNVPAPVEAVPVNTPGVEAAPVVVAPVVAAPGETVVDLSVPTAGAVVVPPKQAEAKPAVSAEPKVAPAKVVSEPGMDDVEFVPAEKAK
jgi:hypothetical protein